MDSKDLETIKLDRETDLRNKQKVCNDLSVMLDQYYRGIEDILYQQEEMTNMGLSTDFLCKNEDPADPGLRDLAAFARFDYVVKCSQAYVCLRFVLLLLVACSVLTMFASLDQ